MTVDVVEQNYKMEQSYNLALALWSLLEQNAASLRAEGAPDAMVQSPNMPAITPVPIVEKFGGSSSDQAAGPICLSDPARRGR